MRTRKAATPKNTPPAKNAPAKTQTTPTSSEPPSDEAPASATTTMTPVSSDAKRGPATRGRQAKSAGTTSTPVASAEPPPEPTAPPVEETKTPGDAVQVTPESKPTARKKIIRRVVRRVVKKTSASARADFGQTPKSGESEEAKVEESGKENDVGKTVDAELAVEDTESAKADKASSVNVEGPAQNEDATAESVEELMKEDLKLLNSDEVEEKEEEVGKASSQNEVKPLEEQDPVVTNVKPGEVLEANNWKEEEELMEDQEKMKAAEDEVLPKNDAVEMEEEPKEGRTDFDGLLEEADDEVIADQEVHDELDQDFAEDDTQDQDEEADTLEEERAELNAAAKERKLRKELEIFVGGLDRDVGEEDIKRVFQNAGEVVDVRLHKDPSTNKNKGYAFVRFATKEQASRALSEMKNPVIRGKRCGTAPSEDNDTLFVGNICNTWTKEAIKQKLKEYGIGGAERITLVADPKHEGLSRGFAFLEFSCHTEAMLAYKRLQKPDAIFGHAERTAKVAFAEPLREPDPEVMAQVKSVFVDGLPPHWDEDHVREKFKQFGEIARIMLARNMSTAKRKDFGFVDFTTHEAAVACIEGINNTELGDRNSKTKVRVRLSNPLPKTQAVKGGMTGGFRIARSGGTFSRYGRGFGRGGHTFNRTNFQHGRDFYHRGPVQGGRVGFANERELDNAYPPLHGRQNFGSGGRWGFRSAHPGPNVGLPPTRPNFDRARYGGHDPLRRQPFPQEEGYNRPFYGRHFDDAYYYDDDATRGMKRPYFMTDQNPNFVEPSTRRPRYDYSETSVSVHGNHYRDAFGADGGSYRQDYYGSDYDGGMRPSYYGSDHTYGRGYYR